MTMPTPASVFSAADHDYMARALRLAERGLWTTAPNPRVGAVLVRDGRVVAEGVDAMLAGLQANGWVAPGSIVVVERGVGAPELNWPAGWTPWPVRRYGDTRVESAEVAGPAC